MPARLKRIYGHGDLHFVTCSCYKREPLLGSRRCRDVFLRIFEQVRRKYRFEVVGYVVMPEHFHVLIGEPEIGTASTVLQVLKQRVGHRLLPPRRKSQNQLGLWRENGKQKKRHFFQPRFYDFNVYTRRKIIEKLRYMHRNPVKRGLVPSPELWAWSSFRAYYFGEKSVVWIEGLNPNPRLRMVKPTTVGGD
ncbi:MAG TPA: transposase [Terriglobales bacterium]|nr:transposase [Terriglobales bacterium]